MNRKKAVQRFPLRRVAAGSLMFAMLSASAVAADAFSYDSPYMFGDWGGSRTQLENDGVKFDVNYTMESASNLGGGADRTGGHSLHASGFQQPEGGLESAFSGR